ncbi:rubrerythrin family protein [Lachnospiraceae bacterium NSJ-143]|nr:rubrerythrin family protein [Lachnospiraceae bacterium NSJ-143]
MEFKGSKTEKNLLASFAGESMARNRYTIYAEQARDQNCEHVSDILLETAHNEYAHAKRVLQFLDGIGTTEENLGAAAQGEHEEWAVIYKQAAQDAYEEGFKEIGDYFTEVAKIEKDHEERFLSLQKMLKDNTMFNGNSKTVWICRNCGHVYIGEQPPEVCDVCKFPRGYFERKKESSK